MIQLGIVEDPVSNQEDSSTPEEENSFHTPRHSQGTQEFAWNCVASQDSIDVFHDAQSILSNPTVLIPPSLSKDNSNLPTKGPLARVRHHSYGSKSCNSSPMHATHFSTNSLRMPSTTKNSILQPTILETKDQPEQTIVATFQHSTSTQTNWRKNYVPCVGLESYFMNEPIKTEELEDTTLLHGFQKLTVEPYTLRMETKQRRGFLRRVKDEFRLANFKLQHKSPHLFVTSQWQHPNNMSCLYLGYRLFWGLYFCLWSVWSLVGYHSYDGPFAMKKFYPIYLTNWCMWILAFDTMLQAVNVVLHMKKLSRDGDSKYLQMQNSFTISWILSNITTTLHIFTTIVFWVAIAPNHHSPYSLIGIHTHIVPCVYVLLDLLISAMPRRIFHFYIPMIFLTIYGVFSDIYYLAGGKTRDGYRAIYTILDWSKPAETLLMTSGLVLILIPLLHSVVVCGVYAFRIKVWSLLKANRYSRERLEEVAHQSIAMEEKV